MNSSFHRVFYFFYRVRQSIRFTFVALVVIRCYYFAFQYSMRNLITRAFATQTPKFSYPLAKILNYFSFIVHCVRTIFQIWYTWKMPLCDYCLIFLSILINLQLNRVVTISAGNPVLCLRWKVCFSSVLYNGFKLNFNIFAKQWIILHSI